MVAPVLAQQPGSPALLPPPKNAAESFQRDVQQDPLQFYRKNPELMRRYFPHLMEESGQMESEPARPSEPIFDIEFPGGPAHILLDHLDIAMGKDKPNIMISPGMTDYEIPAFNLRQVTVSDLFQALNTLSNNEARWELSGSQKPIWILKPAPADSFGYGSGMFAPGAGIRNNLAEARQEAMEKATQVRLQIGQMEAERAQALAEAQRAQSLAQAARTRIDPVTGQFITAEPPKATRVFPLGNYLENYRIEDITTAIQTAWEMMPEKTAGELKFHKDTRLLIAVGSPEQLNLIQEILGSLQGQPLQWGHPEWMHSAPPPPHGMLPPPDKPTAPVAPPEPATKPISPEKSEPAPDTGLNPAPASGALLS